MTIWKFPLHVADSQTLSIPTGYRILDVQVQNDVICMWVLVVPQNPPIHVKLNIFGTGHGDVNNDQLYVGTVQKGGFVWHVFRDMSV